MRRRMKGGVSLCGLLLLVALVVAGCAPQAPAPAPPQAPAATPTTAAKATPTVAAPVKEATVKVGLLGYMSTDTPHYLAVEKGYYAAEGIKVDGQRFDSGAKMNAPLATGELHVGHIGTSVGLFNAIARGLDIRLVLDEGFLTPGHDSDWWVLRPGLKDKIKTPADLKGLKVSVPAPGSALEYMIGKTLAQAGLTLGKEVERVIIPPPELGIALEKGAVDAGISVEPGVTAIEKAGQAVRWVQQSKYVNNPYYQIAAVAYSGKWATENADVAKRFAVAHLKAMRDYYSAMMGGPNRKEVINIMIKYFSIKDAGAYDEMSWNNMNPDGFLIKDSIVDQIDWYAKNMASEMPSKPDINKLIDYTFLNYALEKLGRYKGPGG
ncbi:MAG: ABC transporter substrate-binding protein [Chloroflexi bacterium]|nr:ABC transporter substrate-binding protein [Chloroflexota bacterium]